MRKSAHLTIVHTLGIVASLALGGCGAESESPDENVAETTGRLMTDPAGNIEIYVRTCAFSTGAALLRPSCAVASGYVLVGGGVEVVGPGGEAQYSPGALVASSYPAK